MIKLNYCPNELVLVGTPAPSYENFVGVENIREHWSKLKNLSEGTGVALNLKTNDPVKPWISTRTCTVLNLSGMMLSDVEHLHQLLSLKKLILSENCLTKIPSDVAVLTNLEILDVNRINFQFFFL